ncbi:MAG: hypothetical protein YFSK_7080 [Candidatus Yanofskyibacterium parasiticum]|jgi:restriction system protein|nr:MAG: hypothetical protein YFSK_7080 [Candidatus Yanofskybacteria bacterium]
MEQVLKLSIDFGMIIVKTIEVTLQFLIMLWPVWLIFGIVIFLKFLFVILIPEWLERRRNHKRFVEGEEWRSDRDLIYWLRGMKPDEFENYIADLFSRLGFKTEVVGGSHDGGIDVVAEQNGIKHYIQCKKFINHEVGVGAVRDFYGAVADHLAQGKGYFITTNKFTLEAEKFAQGKPVELIDQFRLVEYIRLAKKDISDDRKQKICSKCGGNLVERAGKYGKFFGCENYPKCNHTEKF